MLEEIDFLAQEDCLFFTWKIEKPKERRWEQGLFDYMNESM
jgi:hypothetical protein